MAGDFFIPVAGVSAGQLADTFGAGRSGGRSHKGIDIFAAEGTPALAVRGGTVVKAGDSGGLGGLRVWVRDDEGLYHYYAHLSSVSVKDGQRIEAGQQLGAVGKTGNARTTPPHLHYSVNPAGHTSEKGSLNPYEFLTSQGAQTAAAAMGGPAPANTPDGTMTAGQQPPQPDPNEQFEREAELNQNTIGAIMSAVSSAASQGGGQILDKQAMFGDIFTRVNGVD